MDEWSFLKEGWQHAPSLIGMIALVGMFLWYLQNKDQRDKENYDKRDTTITLIANQAFEVHKESNNIIAENSKVLGEVKTSLSLFNRK